MRSFVSGESGEAQDVGTCCVFVRLVRDGFGAGSPAVLFGRKSGFRWFMLPQYIGRGISTSQGICIAESRFLAIRV